MQSMNVASDSDDSDSNDSEEMKDSFHENSNVYEKMQLQIEKHYQNEGK